MILKNLLEPRNTGSGVGEYLYVAPISWFVAGGIKKPTPPFLYDGASVTIFDDHEFKEGKKWIQIALPPAKNSVDGTSIGDLGFQKLNQEIKGMIAGSYAEAHELVKNLINIPLIALIPDSNCGEGIIYQLGTECVPAYMSASFATGTTVDGVKGYQLTITSQLGYFQIYQGAILDAIFLALDDSDGDDYILLDDDSKIEV